MTADGSGTPVDVTANLTDPRTVGLAAGVAEFELARPCGGDPGIRHGERPSSRDGAGHAWARGLTVRLLLRDIDATAHDAIEPVALQYRVGAAGPFAALPGGYVADATTGPGEATKLSRVSASLPAAADGQPLVQLRVITTNAAGQDEWVGDRQHRGVGGRRRRERLLRAAGAGSRPRTAGAGPGPSTEAGSSAEAPAPKPLPTPKPPPSSPASGWRPPPSGPRGAARRSCIEGAPARGCASACHARRWCGSKWYRPAAARGGLRAEAWDGEFAPMPRRDRVAPAIRRGQLVRGRAPSTGGRFSARGPARGQPASLQRPSAWPAARRGRIRPRGGGGRPRRADLRAHRGPVPDRTGGLDLRPPPATPSAFSHDMYRAEAQRESGRGSELAHVGAAG